MQLDNVKTVAKREYLARVKTKAFWISTIILPLFMGAMMILPSYFASKAGARQELAVVDLTGRVAEPLTAALAEAAEDAQNPITFTVEVVEPGGDEQALRQELDRRVIEEEIKAWVWVDDTGLAEDRIEYHAQNVSNVITQDALEDAVSEVVRELRLSEAGYDAVEIAELSRNVDLATSKVSATGSREAGGLGSLALAMAMFFTLYIVLIVYGNQVLQGVLEEKSSRIVEVMLSAVTPVEMLAGKLAGICLLGLTQVSIWMGTALVLTAPGVIGALALSEGVMPEIPLFVVAHFIAHFLLGFLLYVSFYAAIGSAFNDLQEAQQLASLAMIFIIGPVMFLFPVINDPGSTLAVVTSLIPPMTPLLMPVRIALETPPWWQVASGYVLTLAFTAGMLWLAGRVYRVGILMYGKKPTVKEIWRWARYA